MSTPELKTETSFHVTHRREPHSAIIWGHGIGFLSATGEYGMVPVYAIVSWHKP